MPTISADAIKRYGCAILLVALSFVTRLVLYPVFGDRYPFFSFFAAIVLAAGYGGYGPSVIAVVLSWLSIDYLFLSSGAYLNPIESRSQIAFGFFSVGLAVTVLGGFWREARERAQANGLKLQRAFEVQKAEREWLEITLASIADAVITTDPTGDVIFLNPIASRLTGWSPGEAVGRPLKEVFRTVQETTQRTDDLPIAKVVGSGEVILSNDEVVLRAKDGTARSIEHNAAPIRDPSGKIKGVVIVFRDITERNRAEQAQKESEDRFHQLADHLSDVFWINELDGSRTGYISPAYESLWGRSCESLYKRPLSYLEAVHAEDRHIAVRAYQRLKSGEATAEEYRVVRPDGTIRWVWDRGYPITDESGRVVRLAGIAEDITERKRVEQELRESDRRKEEFLAVLSHELRNPLAPIQTALDLLEQRDPKVAGSEREIDMIRRQVHNLKRLVDDLLDVSRISRGKIELRKSVVVLRPIVTQAVEALRPLFEEHRQALHVSIPEETICLEADPTRLEQVLFNLLLNAAKFTPEGGQVGLKVESSQRHVVIRVKDTGIGIEADLLPKVFDLFLQGERRIGLSHEGGGIGLSLARNLVELHGGTIKAHSPGPQMGSEFVVRLPVISSVPSEGLPQPPGVLGDVAGPLPSRRILIVDDNVQAADSLGKLMSEVFGQEVRVVYNGRKALETAETFHPDVILLDLQMAGMDGYQAAMRLREQPHCSKALIVAVTGWGHEEDRRRSREMGFDLHLVKPVTSRDLRAVLIDLKSKTEKQMLANPILNCAHC
jgi:two-component system CheB/CheR fusion protein